MNKQDIATQMDQSWNILAALVEGFTDEQWLADHGRYATPARIAIHALVGAEYYIRHVSEMMKRYGRTWDSVSRAELPTRAEVLAHLDVVRAAFAEWLSNLDPDSDNKRFPWAGETAEGVLHFIIRHTLYHIGELNALYLVSHPEGDVDMWMQGFAEQ